MAKSMDVARYLIQLRDMNGNDGTYYSLSNLKLQKLLYYCQGAHHKWDGSKLIDDNFFEAWDYGPVIAEVYRTFKKFGQNDVHNESIKNDLNLTREEMETISAVWRQLREYHAFYLVKSTHNERPWLNARKNRRIHISDEAISEYFTTQEGDA